MRGRVVISCVLVALAVAGCGGSSGSSSSSGQELASSPGIALRGWYSAIEEGNARTACGLLTDRGRRVIRVESGKPCATLSSSPRRGSKPEIGPVGVRRDLALAITGTKIAGLGNVVVLRRTRGRWLVDLPWTPVLDSLHVPGIPPIRRESLPSGGAQMPRILGAAGRYVDKQASSAGAAVHVANAAVVGDVAIAYLLPGSDVPGARPTKASYGDLVLARKAGAWRIIGGETLSEP